MDSKSLSHTKWKCQYHIVFIAKYRVVGARPVGSESRREFHPFCRCPESRTACLILCSELGTKT